MPHPSLPDVQSSYWLQKEVSDTRDVALENLIHMGTLALEHVTPPVLHL